MPTAARPRFAALALVAMLLLALLPTLGRLAGGMPMACGEGPSAAASGDASMAAMMARMTPAEHRAHMAMMARHGRRPAPSGHAAHDCPYCPLLAGLATMATPPWSPHASLAFAPWSVRAVVQRPLDAPVPALGAQGPPARVVA